jgi:hypothetical protein
MTSGKVRTQIIGAAGEAPLTYKLLKHDIDSPRRDSDMAAYEIDIFLNGMAKRRSVEPEYRATEGIRHGMGNTY